MTQFLGFDFLLVIDPFVFDVNSVLILCSLIYLFPDQVSPVRGDVGS